MAEAAGHVVRADEGGIELERRCQGRHRLDPARRMGEPALAEHPDQEAPAGPAEANCRPPSGERTARARRASHPHPAHPRNSRRGCGALAQHALQRATMHAEPSRRLAHVAVALLDDAQDLLPAPAFGPERRPRCRRQRRPAIEQGVHQPRLVQRLRPMSSAPARRQDRRGEAADVGDDDDPHACVPFAQLLDQLQAVVSEPHPDHNVGERCRGGGSGRHQAAGAGNGEPIRYQGAAEAAAGACFVLDPRKRR